MNKDQKRQDPNQKLKRKLKEVQEEIPKGKKHDLEHKFQKVRQITENLKEMIEAFSDNSDDDDITSEWLETQISDLQDHSKAALKILNLRENHENFQKFKKNESQEVGSIFSGNEGNLDHTETLPSHTDNETSFYSAHLNEEPKSLENIDSVGETNLPQATISPLGRLVLLHEKRMTLAEEKMNKIFEMLGKSKIESKTFSEKLGFLGEKIEGMKPPLMETDILGMINKAVDARILDLMENGILYSAVDHKARLNAEMNKLPFVNEYLEKNKEVMKEMVNDTTERLVTRAIGQLAHISPTRVEEMVNVVINHRESLQDDEVSYDESSGLSSFEGEEEEEEESTQSDNIYKFGSLYQYACQLPQPQVPQLPIPLDSRLSPLIIEYNSTYQPYYEACYKELNTHCRNVKNSKYHNIFYPLDNIKIQISIKTPNFTKTPYSEGQGCVIACAAKNDYLAVQNWRGLALVHGGKITSDFAEEEGRGRGWKDVVFLEKGNIWDTWNRNRGRLGSTGMGFGFMGQRKSRSKRKERLSNRSVGGKKSSKRRRRERLSNTSAQKVVRRERLSNRSSGGFRQERLSNRSEKSGNNLTLAVQKNPPAEGLSVSSVGEQQVFKKKGFYYLYDHMEKGLFRRDLRRNSQPQKLMNFNGTSMTGRVIRVGLNEFGTEDHLVLNQENLNLVYLDVQNLQKFDIVPRGEFYENLFIWDFHTLSDNRVAILTNCGFMILMKYFPETKTTFLLSEFQIDLAENEEAYCMAVCPKSRVICVNITRNKNKLSRLVVFEVDDDYLQKKDELVLYDGKIEDIKTMEFYDYFQEKLVLTALTGTEPLTMFGFLYDGVNIREFVQRKVLSDLQMTYKLSRIEGGAEGLITADSNWCLIQIKYKC